MKNIIPTVFLVSIILCMTLLKFSNSESLLNISNSEIFHSKVNDKYYLDKSSLLKVLFNKFPNAGDGSIVITTPKRFGKTTNLQMIATFSEIQVDSKTGLPIAESITDTPNYKLFTGKHKFGEFEIAKDTQFIQQHLGKYPVICMDFATNKPINNVNDLVVSCAAFLREAYKEHRYLMSSPHLRDDQKQMVEYWSNGNYKLVNIPSEDIQTGLTNLIDYLHSHFKTKVIVLIDEYDVPIRSVLSSELNDEKAITDTFWPLIDMLSYGLKQNAGKLKFSVLTGVTYFGSASMSTAIPLQRFQFARNTQFWPYFGFTSEEVDHLLRVSPFKSNTTVRQSVDLYYDGYRVNNNRIYTPMSIKMFLENEKIDQYWHHESNLISSFWKVLRVFEVRRSVLDLIDNTSIVIENFRVLDIHHILLLKKIIETEYMGCVTEYKKSLFFNFILDLGYLRVLSSNDSHCEVDLPNNEIRADILEFLRKYLTATEGDKEIQLQKDILNNLTKLDADHCKSNLQKMTKALHNLCQIVIPRFHYFKEEDLKEILRDTFRRGDLNYYREVRTPSPNNNQKRDGQTNHVNLDFLITNLSSVYVFIETKYGKTSEKGLQQIKDLYLALKDSTEYPMTQPYYLLLGINLSYRKEISVSYGLYRKNEEEICTGTLTAETHSESTVTHSRKPIYTQDYKKPRSRN